MKKIAHLFRCMLTIVSPKLNTYICYFVKFKRTLNLSHPKTLNEKILWLKFNTYWNNPLVKLCADKLSVRYYVKGCGLANILNPLLGVYNCAEEIDWEKLPNQFAIKYNVGCGKNIIVKDKTNLDIQFISKTMNEWFKSKDYLPYSEMQYKDVHPYILIEEYIAGPTKDTAPIDYKVYCFHGKAIYLMACCGRESQHATYYFFDSQWNLCRINKAGKMAPANFSMPKPAHLNNLLMAAERLSSPFPFVRADFYDSKDKIMFGELTFTPGGAMDQNLPHETDISLGNMIQLSQMRTNL